MKYNNKYILEGNNDGRRMQEGYLSLSRERNY